MSIDDRQDVLALLTAKSGQASVVEALEMAAALTEHAAYEYVRLKGMAAVTELILTAARLERIAQEMSVAKLGPE